MLLPAFSTDPYHMRISGGIYGMVSQGGDPDSIFNQVGLSPPRRPARPPAALLPAPAPRATAHTSFRSAGGMPRHATTPARCSWLGACAVLAVLTNLCVRPCNHSPSLTRLRPRWPSAMTRTTCGEMRLRIFRALPCVSSPPPHPPPRGNVTVEP